MTPGSVVAERFDIERLAGQGGHGAVYRARDRHTGEIVALKSLHTPSAQDAERFAREATMLGELSHPGIVRYVAHGVAGSGERYLATEWLEGETLGERLGRHGITIEETLRLVRRAARTLGFLHRKGVVHRDVKPSNLFLVERDIDRLKILDFGIARLVDSARELTLTGTMVGTPGYMAPEQARGERDVAASADVFALGCVLFKCLTGRTPFQGDDLLAVLLRIVLEEAPRTREVRADVPESLDDLVARMLSKVPRERPSDGDAVAFELDGLADLRGGPAEVVRESLTGLTITEQRVMSLVLARPRSSRSSDATITSGDLSARHTALREVAGRFGGSLEHLADGSMLVGFSGGGSATDQAERAARCALAMRPHQPDVPLVVVSGRGVMSARLPMGEVIDRGVQLLASRVDEQLRLDELTAGLIGARFDVRGDGEGLYLRGEREAIDTRRTLLGKPTPCVGRDRELTALLSLFDECASEPVARAVLVTAPAGYGKSRLRYELLRRLAERARDGDAAPLEVWVGRGDPMSAGSPFGMLAPAIRRQAGILDGEPIAARRRKLAARVARHVEPPDLARVTEFVGELCGVPFPDEASVQLRVARQDAMVMGDQMRRAWSDLLVAECTAGPLAIVLEDLHWGDLPSVKLVDAALRAAADRPLLVVALARPEVHELFPKLWSDRDVTEIHLPALTRKAAERLVREVIGPEVKPEVVAGVLERAAGNAFYLEELIRAVAEGKGDALPETVLAMVQARMDGLEPEARRVLRAASVFGQAFWRGGVAALLGGARKAEALDEWLRIHEGRELISSRPVARFPGEQEYVFRHALVREGAYAMLTESDRVLGHRLAARWLEKAGESDAMVMAEHLERGAEGTAAISWYREAAVQALEGNDFDAAVRRADRAVSCGAAGEDRGGLRLVQAEANRWRGDHAAARATALEAMQALGRGSHPWYAAVGEAVLATGRMALYDELAALVDELSAAGWGPRPSAAQLAATARAGFYLFVAGKNDVAEKLLALIRGVDAQLLAVDPAARARIHQACALKALYAADPAGYLTEMQASADSFVEAGDVRSACSQRTNTGFAYVAIGAAARGAEELAEALPQADAMGLHTVAAMIRTNLGLALTHLGKLQEAQQALEKSIEVFSGQRDARLLGASRIYLAELLIRTGDLDGAERQARDAVAVLESTPPARTYALAVLARVLLARGSVDDALEQAAMASALLADLGGIEDGEALVRLVHAEAAHRAGRVDQARSMIGAAAARVRERAAKITEPAWRESFLEKVADNARTLELAAAWGVPG